MDEPDVVRPQDSALSLALAFVRRVEAGLDPSELLSEGAIEEELPNRIFERGARRDVAAMRAGVEKGRTLFRRQRYEVLRALEQGDAVALELDWFGELAVPIRSLSAGEQLRARCAFFFEVKQARIVHLRHYDSFEPF